MKTVACVVVRSAKVFEWLGHMPVVNWAFAQLAEVRGVDRIVCVADPKLAGRATRLLSADGVDVLNIPAAAKTDALLRAWICSPAGPAAGADAVLTVSPSRPFLPAAKIEACLEGLDGAEECYPARPCRVLVGERAIDVLPEILPGVSAFLTGSRAERPSLNTVAVTMIESLDVTDPEGFAMAQAVVQTM